ncbi:MerR family transcriptional regulator [Candidatus Poribacteria bacterium]|nr:MerR family transcriptional regulator [Candidatus Poribacteria bacterium]
MVYTISDLAVETGISYHTVYYYIKEGLIRESNIVGSRQRVFDDHDLERLKQIVALRKKGQAIKYIKELLNKEDANGETKHL